MNATDDIAEPLQTAQHDIDSARGHLETAKYYLNDALGYLRGDARRRAAGALAQLYRALGGLLEAEEMLTTEEVGG